MSEGHRSGGSIMRQLAPATPHGTPARHTARQAYRRGNAAASDSAAGGAREWPWVRGLFESAALGLLVGCGFETAAASPWTLIRLGVSRTKNPIPIIHLGSAFFFSRRPVCACAFVCFCLIFCRLWLCPCPVLRPLRSPRGRACIMYTICQCASH